MIVMSNSHPNLSDESNEDDIDNMDLPFEVQQYRKKYQLLLERCEIIQQDNERIVHRIQRIKKISKQYRKEVKFLMQRLDMYGDDWRTAQMDLDIKTVDLKFIPQLPAPKIDKSTGKGSTPKTKTTTKRKIKTEKAEKDPNAPKRPANPYFQFCQEQRPLALQRLGAGRAPGQPEPSKQELTRLLAQQWHSLGTADKKVYIDMYERSKEKYAEEMSLYVKKE